MGIPIVRCDVVSGEIVEAYENIKVMADYNDISLATAYYRTGKKAEPMDGQRYMFADAYIRDFPDTGAANMKKAEEKMIMAKDIEKAKTEQKAAKAEPKTKKMKHKARKGEPADEFPEPEEDKTEMANEVNGQPSEQANNQTSEPAADMVNHPPHYCTGDIECWDAMVSAFGAEWMKAYATVTAFKYIWRAKHKGRFAEDMKKAAWYEARAAELEEMTRG
ncbi:DUF3310 domain-containing protein [uncultured Anaerovibrio sp.]|uniref:DUF3310 domain-containing protein n=1 Tax=uncultured Anaerovibrio sp. TaxID=361586 RepID=UPI00260BB19E|nr:DUF3310 domain-containing protein [uncultured Anaerovibrio sp.]